MKKLTKIEFKKALIKQFSDSLNYSDMEDPLIEFLFDKMWVNHQRSILMAGDIAKALSKIGDLELELGRGGL